MATTTVKKKRFSLTTVFTLVLQVLPIVLEAINDGAETSHIVIDNSSSDGKLKAHVASITKDGEVSMPSKTASIKETK